MSKIRHKGTVLEKHFEKLLIKNEIFFEKQYDLPGRPDFALPQKKIAIFVNGCFWHKCPKCYSAPKSNLGYWNRKIEQNVRRDSRNRALIKKMGWKVLNIWEHDLKKSEIRKINDIMKMMV